MSIKSYIQYLNLELLLWPAALLALFFMDPHAGSGQSLCLLKQLGISWCPGCGLGHSINYLLHGQWRASFESHPFGAVAVAVLGHRTWQLWRLQVQTFSALKKEHI